MVGCTWGVPVKFVTRIEKFSAERRWQITDWVGDVMHLYSDTYFPGINCSDHVSSRCEVQIRKPRLGELCSTIEKKLYSPPPIVGGAIGRESGSD